MTEAESQLIAACLESLSVNMFDREALAKIRKAAASVAAERISPEGLALAKAALWRAFDADKAWREARKMSGVHDALLDGDNGLVSKWYDEFEGKVKP